MFPVEHPDKVVSLDGRIRPAKATPPEEIQARTERIAKLKEEGHTVKEISKKEKVSTGTVSRYSAKGGLRNPKGPSPKQKMIAEAQKAAEQRKHEVLRLSEEKESADPDRSTRRNDSIVAFREIHAVMSRHTSVTVVVRWLQLLYKAAEEVGLELPRILNDSQEAPR